MMAATQPSIVPVNANGIPASMRGVPRWAPWRAVWNEKKKKYEKAPHRFDRPVAGLSNKSTRGWTTFDKALQAYHDNLSGTPVFDRDGKPVKFGGVGYLLTGPGVPDRPSNVFGPGDLAGVDLDHCRDPKTGVVEDWALEVIRSLDSYTEVSPSGTGLRVMVRSRVEIDIINHERGIEIYGGTQARFVTITGAHYPGSPLVVGPSPAGAMDALAAKYRRQHTAATVEDLHLPQLIPVELLPDVRDLDLPTHALNFFTDGPVSSDRSNELINAATALAQAGIERDEVLSILEANEHAIEVALDHRRQDYDSALRFLWKHSALAAEQRAETFKRLSWDQFDPLDEPDAGIPASPEQAAPAAAQAADSTDDFDDLGPPEQQQQVAASAAPVKAPRFTPVPPAAFLKRKPGSWIIKGIVPRAGLAVIYGASGSGKTFLTLDMVGAIARGVPWRGATVQKGRVVYVVAEGASGFRNRLEAYCDFHGVDPGDFDIGVIADAPNIRAKEDVRALLEALKTFGKVDMVVIDTYARAMAGGNENDAKDVGEAIQHCDVIHRVTKGLVVLVHHSGKDATKGARGSGALRAAADLEIEVVQTREYRAATITKQKDGEDGAEYQFKLAEVVIGQDEEGDSITSCIVEHSATAAGAAERKANPEGVNEKLVFRYMEAIMEGSIKREELIENTYEMLDHEDIPGKKDRRKERVGRAIKSLVSKNLLEDDGLVVSIK